MFARPIQPFLGKLVGGANSFKITSSRSQLNLGKSPQELSQRVGPDVSIDVRFALKIPGDQNQVLFLVLSVLVSNCLLVS